MTTQYSRYLDQLFTREPEQNDGLIEDRNITNFDAYGYGITQTEEPQANYQS